MASKETVVRELYLAIVMDRATRSPVIVASSKGGVDIEQVLDILNKALH